MLPVDRCAHTNRLRTRHSAEKILLAMGMLGMALMLPPFPGCLVIACVMVSATLGWAAVPRPVYLQALSIPLGFLVTGILPLLVSASGAAHGGIHLAWAPDGGAVAARVALRSLAGINCVLFLALTTPVPQLLTALRRCGVPAAMVEVALLVYRFAFAFLDTMQAMHVAQASRLGYRDTRHAIRSLGLLCASFFARVFERTRRMEQGLSARGWSGEMRVLSEQNPASVSALALIAGGQALLAVALLLWNRVASCPI